MGFMHRNIIGDFRTNATYDLLIESDILSVPRTGESEIGSPCPDQNRRKKTWYNKRLNQQNPLHGSFLCLNTLLGRWMLTFERVGLVLMPRRSWLTHESIVKNRTRNALLLLPLRKVNCFCTRLGYARFRLSLPCPTKNKSLDKTRN